ncbi:MAG: MBL fold metallo-hydrolase, partial [Candidatus Hydrogenedens sp.]
MIIYHFCTRVNEANAYLLIDTDTKECLLIDVPAWTERMQKILDEHKARLIGVFITHEHYDHTSGLSELYKTYPDIKRYPQQEFFNDTDNEHYNKISVGKWEGKILYLPGHTPESVG